MALGYVGAQTTMSEYNNGGQLLASVVNQMLGATGSVIPVSYTHLDVYKRQRQDCRNKNR